MGGRGKSVHSRSPKIRPTEVVKSGLSTTFILQAGYFGFEATLWMGWSFPAGTYSEKSSYRP
eukprot:1153215-Pelagomonas_calceolata.AAC.6